MLIILIINIITSIYNVRTKKATFRGLVLSSYTCEHKSPEKGTKAARLLRHIEKQYIAYCHYLHYYRSKSLLFCLKCLRIANCSKFC